MYFNPHAFTVDTRYGNRITVPLQYGSDGATGGLDVCDKSFFVHDWLCGNWAGKGPKPPKGLFDDGTQCTNWRASTIHCDLLRECAKERKGWRGIGLYAMSIWRWPIIFLFGGGEARKNGMFKIKIRRRNIDA